jgi:hypothetical protein
MPCQKQALKTLTGGFSIVVFKEFTLFDLRIDAFLPLHRLRSDNCLPHNRNQFPVLTTQDLTGKSLL